MSKNKNNNDWNTCDQPITYGQWLESKKDLFSDLENNKLWVPCVREDQKG